MFGEDEHELNDFSKLNITNGHDTALKLTIFERTRGFYDTCVSYFEMNSNLYA